MTFVKIFNDTANSRSLQFETKLVVDAFMAAFEGWPTHQVSIRSMPGKVEAIFNTAVSVYGIRWEAAYYWQAINLTQNNGYKSRLGGKDSVRSECLGDVFKTVITSEPFLDERLHADESAVVAFNRLPAGSKASFPDFIEIPEVEPEYQDPFEEYEEEDEDQ
jgi:hypothetical protein